MRFNCTLLKPRTIRMHSSVVVQLTSADKNDLTRSTEIIPEKNGKHEFNGYQNFIFVCIFMFIAIFSLKSMLKVCSQIQLTELISAEEMADARQLFNILDWEQEQRYHQCFCCTFGKYDTQTRQQHPTTTLPKTTDQGPPDAMFRRFYEVDGRLSD